MTNLYVITGGPGTGKTSLINLLMENNIHVVPEAAARIIEEEKKAKKPEKERIVPWNADKRQEFQKKVFEMHSDDLKKISPETEKSFLDRSYIDNIAYHSYYGLTAKEEIIHAAKSCNYEKVYILDRLPSKFYAKTKIRRENEEEAKQIHNKIIETYMKYLPMGKIVMVPAALKTEITEPNDLTQAIHAVSERMYFILRDAKGIKQ